MHVMIGSNIHILLIIILQGVDDQLFMMVVTLLWGRAAICGAKHNGLGDHRYWSTLSSRACPI